MCRETLLTRHRIHWSVSTPSERNAWECYSASAHLSDLPFQYHRRLQSKQGAFRLFLLRRPYSINKYMWETIIPPHVELCAAFVEEEYFDNFPICPDSVGMSYATSQMFSYHGSRDRR